MRTRVKIRNIMSRRSMSRMKCLKVTIPAKAPGRRDIGTYQEVVEPMEHKK